MCLEKINRPCHIYQCTKSFENLVKNLKVNMNAVIICDYFLSVKLIHKRLKYKKKNSKTIVTLFVRLFTLK